MIKFRKIIVQKVTARQGQKKTPAAPASFDQLMCDGLYTNGAFV
jgi:hypothetical protein